MNLSLSWIFIGMLGASALAIIGLCRAAGQKAGHDPARQQQKQ